jgi:peptidoglycan/xylan/chitin deacetylase (PgdA/CDA1 family)
MMLEALGAAAVGGGVLAWGVRGRASSLLAPSVWRGPTERKAMALTFDDGPSESTHLILDVLERHGAKGTFFQCGHHVGRLPEVARRVAEGGHEIGNHTDSHAALYLRSPAFIEAEVGRAQEIIERETGVRPRLFRAPYGGRWFGLREVQQRHGLMGVMWTVIAQDWRLSGPQVALRLLAQAGPGAVICLHDGRDLTHRPDITATVEAMRRLVPVWRERGYELVTVSELFGFTAPGDPSVP